MPANLPPNYYDAEKRYRLAVTPQEKIAALEEMLRIMPKHKGTDKLQADVRRRISKHKTESTKSSSGGGRRTDQYVAEKAGAGQVALVGTPNTGKSQLMTVLTNAKPEVAEYPFTTRMLTTGMMRYENVRIQLVDLPPIHPDLTEAWVYAVMRNADALWIVLDLGEDDVLEHVEFVLDKLEEAKIKPIEKAGGEEDEQHLAKKTLMVGNKIDSDHAADRLEMIEEFLNDRFNIIRVSAKEDEGLDTLSKATFDLLEKIRIYTKTPGKEPDYDEPVTLPVGSTVSDFAEQIHKDFAQKLKFARIWGQGKHDGQRVQKDFLLDDGDTLELHI